MEPISRFSTNSSNDIELDDEQSKVLEFIKSEKRNIFITGGAGVGKSFLLTRIIDTLKKRNSSSVLVGAPTGIAALNVRGSTLHSLLGIGPHGKTVQSTIAGIKGQKVQKIQQATTLVIDEISMVPPWMFSLLDDVFRAVRGIGLPFGGIRMIVVGDFFQLPPIERRADEEPRFDFLTKAQYSRIPINYCFQTPSWIDADFHVFNLRKVHRQSETAFIKVLNDLRFGLSPDDSFLGACMSNSKADPFDTKQEINGLNKNWISVYCKKVDVAAENAFYYQSIPDEDETVYDGETYIPPGLKPYQQEISRTAAASLETDCQVPKNLRLKVGTRVMLVRNISSELCNGKLGTVKELPNDRSVTVLFDGLPSATVLSRVSWEREFPWGAVTFSNIPLCYAYASTVHKMQGMSVDRAVVDCASAFAAGQVYVALSRVRCSSGLKIIGLDPNQIQSDPDVLKFYEDDKFLLPQKYVDFLAPFLRVRKVIKKRENPSKSEEDQPNCKKIKEN